MRQKTRNNRGKPEFFILANGMNNRKQNSIKFQDLNPFFVILKSKKKNTWEINSIEHCMTTVRSEHLLEFFSDWIWIDFKTVHFIQQPVIVFCCHLKMALILKSTLTPNECHFHFFGDFENFDEISNFNWFLPSLLFLIFSMFNRIFFKSVLDNTNVIKCLSMPNDYWFDSCSFIYMNHFNSRLLWIFRSTTNIRWCWSQSVVCLE